MGLVLWIRVTPLSLPAAEDWARGMRAHEMSGDLAARARRLRSQLSYQAADGREFAYLGDFDSYHWLRLARNYLRRGTACDAVVDGQCRDTYANAPVGSRMIYTRSLHVLAIVAVHKAIAFFDPNYPLSASSFWVPVVVGVVGVLPAFFLGRRVGGSIGGVCAATFISLNPLFLQRTMGSDNDVWNGVLPLFVAAALLSGLAAPRWPQLVLFVALAGALTALQATTWRGWLFIYGVALVGLLVHLVASAVPAAGMRANAPFWRSADVRRAAGALFVYYLATDLAMRLAGYEKAYLSAFSMLVFGDVAPTEPGYWPRVLRTVQEFSKPDLREIIRAAGGVVLFIAGVVGILLMVLPKGRWRSSHFALLALSLASCATALTIGHGGRNGTVALFAAALAAPMLPRLFAGKAEEKGPDPAIALVIVWFLTALLFAHEGSRYPVLLVPPLGIGIAVVVGRLHEWLATLAALRTLPRDRWLARAVAFTAIISLTLAPPVRQAYAAARNYAPAIDDAWWLTLERIEQETPADAIVSTWWDYGYWVKFVAQRRVTTTGGSLLTHVPHWLAKAFVTPEERQAVGILRMLDCGSDTLPLRDGSRGAYGKIMAAGRDAVAAYATVMALVELDRAPADAYLLRHGFTPVERAGILQSTHCAPPESYLILTSDLLRKSPAWAYLGGWDLRRAYVAQDARLTPRAPAVKDLAGRLDVSEGDAARLYDEAAALPSQAAVDEFIAPHQGEILRGWRKCHDEEAGASIVCPIDVSVGQTGVSLLVFAYDPVFPAGGRLRRQRRGRIDPGGASGNGTPAVLVLAGADRLDTTVFPRPAFSDLGILVDVANRRILAGMPALVRSTFTHLMYLDGRYATHFEKFDDRQTDLGNRVVTWKVRWPAD